MSKMSALMLRSRDYRMTQRKVSKSPLRKTTAATPRCLAVFGLTSEGIVVTSDQSPRHLLGGQTLVPLVRKAFWKQLCSTKHQMSADPLTGRVSANEQEAAE